MIYIEIEYEHLGPRSFPFFQPSAEEQEEPELIGIADAPTLSVNHASLSLRPSKDAVSYF